MKREIPLLLTMVFGLLMIVDFFVPHPVVARAAQSLRDQAIIVTAFAYFLGAGNVVAIHARKMAKPGPDRLYAAALLAGFALMTVLGLAFGVTEDKGAGGRLFNNLFLFAYTPMQATMFALLAFYVASAAFRAFRIRTVEAALLAVTAILVMIGRVPIGGTISAALHLPPALSLESIETWIMDVPNLAAKRAVLIGAALGAIATGLKIVLGIEQNYFGEKG